MHSVQFVIKITGNCCQPLNISSSQACRVDTISEKKGKKREGKWESSPKKTEHLLLSSELVLHIKCTHYFVPFLSTFTSLLLTHKTAPKGPSPWLVQVLTFSQNFNVIEPNQHLQTRYSTLFTATFIQHFRIIFFWCTIAHRDRNMPW